MGAKVRKKIGIGCKTPTLFLFNFREIMSKMRELVYFETIFVNFETPAWEKQENKAPPTIV